MKKSQHIRKLTKAITKNDALLDLLVSAVGDKLKNDSSNSIDSLLSNATYYNSPGVEEYFESTNRRKGQNVTLYLNKKSYAKMKVLAREKNTSVSAMVNGLMNLYLSTTDNRK